MGSKRGKASKSREVNGVAVRVEMRQEKVAEMYTRGMTQAQIAKELGVTQPVISMDLKSLRAAWTENSMWSMNEAIGQQLGKLDLVEMRAWESFEISMRGPPRVVKDGEGNPTGEHEPWESLPALFPGEPKYLEIVKDCVEKRCKIFGIGKEDKAQNATTVNVIGADFWDRVAGPSNTKAVEDAIAAEEARAIGPRVVKSEDAK